MESEFFKGEDIHQSVGQVIFIINRIFDVLYYPEDLKKINGKIKYYKVKRLFRSLFFWKKCT
jgi:hypothetical protein